MVLPREVWWWALGVFCRGGAALNYRYIRMIYFYTSPAFLTQDPYLDEVNVQQTRPACLTSYHAMLRKPYQCVL